MMAAHGYRLLFKSGLQEEYDRDNFPKELRLRQRSGLLFVRE